MFKGWNTCSIVIILCIGCTSLLFSRDKKNQDSYIKFTPSSTSAITDSIVTSPVKWPTFIASQETEKFRTLFDNFGHIGSGFAYSQGIEKFEQDYGTSYSFESPPNSTIEYLFGAGIWVGAIVGSDTLVSTSVDGWYNGYDEFAGNVFQPSIKKITFPSDYSLRCQFNDTSTLNILNDKVTGKPHTPLNVKITDKSYVWRNAPLDNAVIYDYTFTNIGDRQLEKVYIGFYFDCDIGSKESSSSVNYFKDDVSGTLRDSGIAYILDADGDPDTSTGSFNNYSSTKAFAFELLATSFVPSDTNYNWWTTGKGYFDFSPRLKGTPEDPYRNVGVIPNGDRNKYYMMRHKEWDYDMALCRLIDQIDTTWISPLGDIFPHVFDNGSDVKFLYSIGPFDLEPGQSERILFSTFTADSIHISSTNLPNLKYNPLLYIDNLNLENLVLAGSAIRTAVDSILNPLLQPTGLEVDEDNKISFDPYVFDDVTGYNVYSSLIDPTTLPFLGIIPPWYKPTSLQYVGHSIDEIPIDDLDRLTAVQVSYTSALGESELSEPVYLNIPNPVLPITSEYTITQSVDSAVISWTIPDTGDAPILFKVYKFAPDEYPGDSYTQPYFLEGGGDTFTSDSILVDNTWWFYQSSIADPYAIIASSGRQFIDYNVQDGALYYIVSVDRYGFESKPAVTKVYVGNNLSKDLLIVLKTESATISTSEVTIKNFYENLLGNTQLDYDFYSVADSMSVGACSYFYCPSWQKMSQYKFVLVDESEYNAVYWDDELPFYLASGGTLINFGSVSKLFSLQHNTLPMWYSDSSNNASFLGIDSIFSYGHLYRYPIPIEEGIFGFHSAESKDALFPSLECDTSKYPLDNFWNFIPNIPFNEPLQVACMIPKDSTEITHIYKSLYPTTSYMQDLPVGIKHLWKYGNNSTYVYSYGFHLYYMKENDSRKLLSAILGVEIQGCCAGMRGNIDKDADNIIDIADLVYMVDFMFLGGPAPNCIEQANINGDLGEHIDISDLVALVYFMYGGGPVPAMCP